MFAVKGWSVDATKLKPQTEVFKAGDGSTGNKSKKRKRNHKAKQDSKISSDDVSRLWEQHIEGIEPSQKPPNKERKKQKREHPKVDQVEHAELPRKSSKVTDQSKTERRGDALVAKAEKVQKPPKEKKAKKKRRESVDGDQDVAQDVEQVNRNSKVNGKENAHPAKAVPVLPPAEKLTPMQSAMRQKLVSSRFRYLNQTLYTEPSTKAQQLFNQDPAMFDDYHAGFRRQVSSWPENPVTKFIAEVRRRAKIKPMKAPKRRKSNASVKSIPQDANYQLLPRTHGTCIIADLGCGDATFAQTLTKTDETKLLNLKIHSFDLHSPSPLVTKADISNLLLKDDSVDVAILCLALMGTNWVSFIEEAYRILHWKGELWIAEIKSRFGRVSRTGKPVEHSVGSKKKQLVQQKAREAKLRETEETNEQEVLQTEVDGVVTNMQETDVSAFVAVLKRRGFILKGPSDKAVDVKNKMFVKMEFIKASTPTKGKGVPKDQPKDHAGKAGKPKLKFVPDGDEEPSTEDEATVLKPCLYKIR